MHKNAQKKITELSSNNKEESNKEESNKEDTTTDGKSTESGKELGLGDIDDTSNDSTDSNNESKEINFEEIKNDFMNSKDNELSEDIINKLKESGQSEFLIEQFKNTIVQEKQQIIKSTQEFTESIYESVGSREKYVELMQHVKSELGEAEIESYKEVVDSGNKSLLKRLVNSYMNEFSDKLTTKNDSNESDAKKAKSLNASNSGGDTSDKFKSKSEWYDAINSKKYQSEERSSDRPYQKMIDDKAKRSGFF